MKINLTSHFTDVLNCKYLSCRFAHQEIFSNLSFDLKFGESLSIVGENGSGKTTLLKILAGLLKPAEGNVVCCGEEIWPWKNFSFEHKSIYLSYTPGFYLDQSVWANLDFYLKSYGICANTIDKQNALKQVELWSKSNEIVHNLSSGQKRRITLAALLLIKPRLVFADEPTNGLDARGFQLCLRIFNDLMENEKRSFVIATHDDKFKNWTQKCVELGNFKPNDIKTHKKNKIKALL